MRRDRRGVVRLVRGHQLARPGRSHASRAGTLSISGPRARTRSGTVTLALADTGTAAGSNHDHVARRHARRVDCRRRYARDVLSTTMRSRMTWPEDQTLQIPGLFTCLCGSGCSKLSRKHTSTKSPVVRVCLIP